MSEYVFSKPIEVKPAEGHRTRGEKIATVEVDGKPLIRIPDFNLREEIIKAGSEAGLIIRSFGTFPELGSSTLIGMRVEEFKL